MANILYAINGEGSGHWTRSSEIIRHLSESGHKITIVASGQASLNLKTTYPIEEIFGFKFKYTKGKLNEFASVFTNWHFGFKIPKNIYDLNRLIKNKDINIVITDFEPISGFVAHIKKIPCISISNQALITNSYAEMPNKLFGQQNTINARIIIKTIISGAQAKIALSFFNAKPRDNSTFILPPVIRRGFFDLKPSYEDYIIIYFTHGFEGISKILKEVDYKFIFYGANKDRVDKNITFKKFNPVGFLDDISHANGVLGTSSFSLISESLYLRKPFLAWPTKRQYEQVFNAYHIERLGYGKYIKKITAKDIRLFLKNIDAYKSNLASYPYSNNDIFFAKLDELIGKFVR